MDSQSLRHIRHEEQRFRDEVDRLKVLLTYQQDGASIPDEMIQEHHQNALDHMAEIEDIISDSMASMNTFQTPNGEIEIPEQARGVPARSREERGRPEPDSNTE